MELNLINLVIRYILFDNIPILFNLIEFFVLKNTKLLFVNESYKYYENYYGEC
jgi:hypothetical protein